MVNETICDNIIVPLRSRWRFESHTLPDLGMYITDIQHDYFSKSIGIRVLDAIVKGKPIIHDWVLRMLLESDGEIFTLHHHDGNGNLLYKKILKGIKLIGHKCNHNYEKDGSDLQDHELFFTYDEINTVNNLN